MIHDSAVRQAESPVRHYGARLRGMVGSRRKAPGITDFEPLSRRPRARTGHRDPARTGSAHAGAGRGGGRDPRLDDGTALPRAARLTGFEFVATDCSWSTGRGHRVEGTISAILLLLTCRDVALSQLSGPGMAELRARLSSPPRGVRA
ncbi:hypothetical protein [Planotetraspora silvatica]|uniref:hypothetical protein n=1 Tax=Planotetraspora silvatica TaxID=234614 RepID=UPI00194FEE27|nr:hypothetical protein [Planotetraspora silvatica]